ncbi:MAG: hypothetical protein IJO13_06700 [Lachnospiraceae bacterium]|nr:hypothetical protein [Lachnospiraceae bacterium]
MSITTEAVLIYLSLISLIIAKSIGVGQLDYDEDDLKKIRQKKIFWYGATVICLIMAWLYR